MYNGKLRDAIYEGDVERVKELINFVNKDEIYLGKNWIHYATRENKLDVLKFLIEDAEICINLKTCLHYAARYGSYEVTKYLLEMGIDKQSKDYDHFIAAQWGFDQKMKDFISNFKQ